VVLRLISCRENRVETVLLPTQTLFFTSQRFLHDFKMNEITHTTQKTQKRKEALSAIIQYRMSQSIIPVHAPLIARLLGYGSNSAVFGWYRLHENRESFENHLLLPPASLSLACTVLSCCHHTPGVSLRAVSPVGMIYIPLLAFCFCLQ